MADTKRTVKVQFDGDTKGLGAAAGQVGKDLGRIPADARRAGADASAGFESGFVQRGGFGVVGKEAQDASDEVQQAAARLARAQDSAVDAFGRVRVAQAQLNEMREKGKASAYQLAAAEERLEAALRKLTRAQDTVRDSQRALGEAGKEAGREVVTEVGTSMSRTAGAQGPLIAAALVGSLPFAGAVAATGIVAAFGGGLTGMGLAAAAQHQDVKNEFLGLKQDLATAGKGIAEPFAQSLIDIANQTRDTFDFFEPTLERASTRLAPVVSRFTGNLSKGFRELEPAIEPLTDAFAAILDDIGPRLPGVIDGISRALENLAESVEENPEAIGQVISLLGNVAEASINTATALNDGWSAWTVPPSADTAPAANEAAEAFDRNAKSAEELAARNLAAYEAANRHREALVNLANQAHAGISAQHDLAGALLGLEAQQKATAEAVKEHGAKSLEGREALHQLQGAYLDVANATRAKAEAESAATTEEGKAIDGARAYAGALLNLALQSKGPVNASLAELINGLGASELAAIDAAVATGQFGTKVITLPDGKTIRVAVDDKGTPVIDSFQRRLDDLRDKTVTLRTINETISIGGGGRLDPARRAAGGPVWAGRTYWVGEQGPELITMGGNGYVTPNHELGAGGDTIVNVLIDGQQLQARIDSTVRESNRSTRRAVRAGVPA